MDISKFIGIEQVEERIYALANCIEQTLLARGYIVHRKEEIKSNSVYIKIDYGVGGSIRISDQESSSKIEYRYNLEASNQSGGIYTHVTPKGDRYYYSYTRIEELLKEVIREREARVKRYKGAVGYYRLVEKERRNIDYTQGFWNGAYEVKLSNLNRIKVWLNKHQLEEEMMNNIVEFTRERNDRLDLILKNTRGGWKGLSYKYLNLIVLRYKELLESA